MKSDNCDRSIDRPLQTVRKNLQRNVLGVCPNPARLSDATRLEAMTATNRSEATSEIHSLDTPRSQYLSCYPFGSSADPVSQKSRGFGLAPVCAD